MIKILGISGSPRKDGNTVQLLKEALGAAAEEEEATTELISLVGKDIKPCDGCRTCRTTKECHVKDDLQALLDKMVEADGIILATPVYYGSATPQIKALMDRAGYLASAKGRLFENKVGGPLVVARRAGQNFTFAQLMFFFFITGMIIPGSTYWTMAFGREKREVLGDDEGMETAKNFAKKMVWVAKKLKEP
jgi:multimeric flavodoxin WrbA